VTIGERVRARRKALHLSQEDIARRAGVSLNQINRLERGEIESPRFTTMVNLAHSLGMRVEDFVDEEEMKSVPLVG